MSASILQEGDICGSACLFTERNSQRAGSLFQLKGEVCYFRKIYWPHSLILGTELPSFGIILISCERLCAVLRPAAYNRIFMGKFKVALLLTVPLAGIISVAIAGLSTLGDAGNLIAATQHCAIIASTAIWLPESFLEKGTACPNSKQGIAENDVKGAAGRQLSMPKSTARLTSRTYFEIIIEMKFESTTRESAETELRNSLEEESVRIIDSESCS
ncbi:hypothetical protein RB195_015206 [Necator americanus]|uniref:Uncharacterized protein n=1 Tax=Necator americanus TaxID=51031 RepID=A0ABR1E3H8_NECAM